MASLQTLPAGENSDKAPEKKPHPRTPGLKLFDVFLYPILTNFSVFGISVAATYLTNRGGMKNANGELIYGKVGEWFESRGNAITHTFQRAGMTHEQADMSKMVFFSFADGSLMAPAVKLLEDRRENIARRTDKFLGTEPDNDAVYKAEPKQSWSSVLGGRLLTSAIVVPTAIAMDKSGMNHVLFHSTSKNVASYLGHHPELTQILGKSLDVPELAKVGVFEGFYTSVCTGGLYFSSRAIARVKETLHPHHLPTPDTLTTPSTVHESAERGLAI